MKKSVNGILVDMTDAEITQRQTDETKASIQEQNEEQAKADAEANASTGKQKLKDLGLNDAEIKALIGV